MRSRLLRAACMLSLGVLVRGLSRGAPAAAGGGRVVVDFLGEKIAVQRGEILRTALLKGGLSPHNGNSKLINCRGLGTCGTCAVLIEGPVVPEELRDIEKARLSLPPHSPGSGLRLACQVQVEGDLVVSKKGGFWGSRMAEDSRESRDDFKTYFGDLEYALDDLKKVP